ncbi:MAG TPA: phosphoribosylformylglycinamidine synthase [Clostridiaceae bacterium]|nr:phosphoribosylformylglycinamidine synthase [Clostridiaceae bacterium]
MKNTVRRIFVEKKQGFNIEAQKLYNDLRENLGIIGLESVRVINRYDIEGMDDNEFEASKNTVFSEPQVDIIYNEQLEISPDSRVIAIEYLPGQYDQRADSAAQCVQILTCGEKPEIKVAKIIILEGCISDDEYENIKKYCINPVESREASLEKPLTLKTKIKKPEDVKEIKNFINMSNEELQKYMNEAGFAMSIEDLRFCQSYFRDVEKRNPTVTEMKVIDTYWSDHCRHTTFLTKIEKVKFEDGYASDVVKSVYGDYLESRNFVYKDKDRDITLMDLATIAMKEMKKRGMLKDLDESEEINACSIVVNVIVDGKDEEWLVMFKNETHNHPTEIEPFGGAATCLGGAIRDPLSGRSYVYQAMRVTGSGDPRASIEDTLPGKLPQRKITTVAAAGYSSYGNQVGLATGQVAEVYHEGYVAKRLELGAVIGAAPKKNVIREKPQPGDVIILLGGRTGRDGCGGATGSSKAHTDESLMTSGAEVQKGNPPTERKIQRLFRKPEVSTMIKKCNDFGAGGVSVAIGELADGLEINLDAVPKKYEGLDGTELAISESQERMAVLLSKDNVEAFINAAQEENLEATPVAVVTEQPRMKMIWRGQTIVDISREFLNTNGVKQITQVKIKVPDKNDSFFNKIPETVENSLSDLKSAWLNNLERLNVCSQKGLVEMFDSTIGAGTILMPLGGKYQLTPSEGMAAKIPVLDGDTTTGTLMTFGFNPYLSEWSPFHGALYAVIEAVSKIVAMGGDFRRIRLSLQEYFEKLGKNPEKWGKPFSALLGAFKAQKEMGIPAIGGKDSMSGTFNELNVPPTLVAFAVDIADADKVVSAEFKQCGSKVVLIPLKRDHNEMPDFDQLRKNYVKVHELIINRKVLASCTVKCGGVAEAISKMAFGNRIGFAFNENIENRQLFLPGYGSIILELPGDEDTDSLLEGVDFKLLGYTQQKAAITVNGTDICLEEALSHWEKPLESVFPTRNDFINEKPKLFMYNPPADKISGNLIERTSVRKSFAKPRVYIPVFPGTNCEYDTMRAFEKAGALVNIQVIKNMSSKDIEDSIKEMAENINKSQIVMIPGGFSGGDEPDGSGKFIATAFRNPYVSEAIMNLLKNRDGLMLGICNGFQALIKLGLLPYGEIRKLSSDSPTLTFNTIGRHVSTMARTIITSKLSPWFSKVNLGDIYTIALSHGEGRFVATEKDLEIMGRNGQIAAQYVDMDGNPTYDSRFNPNGSIHGIECITSPDGRVLGKMGHSERIGTNVAKNVPGEKDQKIFEAGVEYFS